MRALLSILSPLEMDKFASLGSASVKKFEVTGVTCVYKLAALLGF